MAISVFSQTGRGAWLAGGNIGFSSATEHDNPSTFSTTKTTTFVFAPDFGYFIINNLAAGAEVTYLSIRATNGPNSATSNAFSAGPFIRYYFPIAKKIKIFVHGNILWGSENYNDGEPKTSTSIYGFKAGPAFFLNSRVAFEITAGYQHTKSKSDYYNSTTGEFMMGAGFQIHLGK